MFEKYVKKLNVLYEDNHIIVVEKFENILSQKDITNDFSMIEIIKEYIRIKASKPGNVFLGLVHRLDRRVGGIMVFAKTSKAASRLSEQIRNREVGRKYIACVLGNVNKSEDTLVDYLYKDQVKKTTQIVSRSNKQAKQAILKYRVINFFKKKDLTYTYLDVELVTGRYNQIRAQLASINHPIVNDNKYGSKTTNENRIGLWCSCLSFIHPTTKEFLEFKLLPKGEPWEGLHTSSYYM